VEDSEELVVEELDELVVVVLVVVCPGSVELVVEIVD
jgi:hypothetical protein